MNKKSIATLVVGLLVIAITLVIFFIPRIGDERETVEYIRLGFIIASQVIVMGVVLYTGSRGSVFLTAGLTSTMTLYFIINLVGILLLTSIPNIITFGIVLNLIVAIIVIVFVTANTILEKEANNTENNIDIPKSGSSF